MYFSQISQAMVVKIETEVYRVERGGIMNTMGALYWQLNDVWVAPSWSSIDYMGQFKILHYWAKDFLAPLTIVGHVNKLGRIELSVIRDTLELEDEKFTVMMKIHKWDELSAIKNKTWNITMERNSVKRIDTIRPEDYLAEGLTAENSFFVFLLLDERNKVKARNFLLPEKLINTNGIRNPEIQLKIAFRRCSYSVGNISLEIRIRAPAIFVQLELKTTNKDNLVLKHFFSRNGFIQTLPIQTINLEYENEDCLTEINVNDISVMTVNQFF